MKHIHNQLTKWFYQIHELLHEVWNSRVTKSSVEAELRKMTSHSELLTRKCLQKFFFRVNNSTL